ncbi:helix-turn-helix transcriptional regulator [Actinacidiphila guanduensis]|uniref:Regulatory protein, luxR family n=1 Tax=Actinacidiphila guanduensis TaxID=310781 RepID=A0A1G9W4V9_9ACTN|nr:helix-turn-helix transcriptional regulator [Actinacidiphila guanduensis]SDM79246.1 regulatory protein, luxR family [Actinacidiphila guanduensis]
MSIRRRLSEAAQAVDELYSDPAAAAGEYERFRAALLAERNAAPSGAGADHEGDAATGTALGDSPGLLFVDMDLTLVSASVSARRWLGRLRSPSAGTLLPDAVTDVARRLREGDPEGPSSEHIVRQLEDGTQVDIHAWMVPRGDSGSRMDAAIAVAIGVADPATATEYLLGGYGLTRRQNEVAYLILLGLSIGEMARRLDLTESTVREHMRALFAKVDCSSRREFAEMVFMLAFLTHLSGEPLPPAPHEPVPPPPAA